MASSTATGDPRLKIIEVMLTLGGFLGIVLSLQQARYSQVIDLVTVFIILFVVGAFLTYSGIILKRPRKSLEAAFSLFGASFSGLVVIAFLVPIEDAALSLGVILRSGGVSTTSIGTSILFVVAFAGVLLILYYAVSAAIKVVLKEPPPTG